MTKELAEVARRTMIVISDDGEIISGGRSVLFALEESGWHHQVMRHLARRPLVWAVDAGYRLVASNRQVFSQVLF